MAQTSLKLIRGAFAILCTLGHYQIVLLEVLQLRPWKTKPLYPQPHTKQHLQKSIPCGGWLTCHVLRNIHLSVAKALEVFQLSYIFSLIFKPNNVLGVEREWLHVMTSAFGKWSFSRWGETSIHRPQRWKMCDMISTWSSGSGCATCLHERKSTL